MKKILMGIAFMALALVGCAGTSDDPEALDNALVGFTSCVQSSRWQEALAYVTDDEANQISPDGYDFKPEYQVAARRLPLSTLRKAGLQVDGKGRLVGIKAAMDEANERYVVSEEQAKVGTNLEEMEKKRIQRRLEEGQKILQEEEQEAEQEQQVEVFTNKLTDEEKRKYGSTRDLQAPEEFHDENTEEAEEKIFNGDYESD
ncbi:hypothetical protein SAMN05720781_0539 [Fibrobacter sp. UWT3]|jgi:hypothetical protein|uniref:hypothetical protein n=1 Tax=Fibrobacter sp. UWT3 TaxID=1896225 RepID=UPI000BC4D919|nr:hypothetical protein [Fibrobacter sp. UWT3]SOE53028.1 hypothetical protein SAMN05720781_0539 [Fibrobacter sp. UWT3]